jgi:hypothetical protein
MPVSNGTLSPTKLEGAYQQGYAQALRELPRLREYLGLQLSVCMLVRAEEQPHMTVCHQKYPNARKRPTQP